MGESIVIEKDEEGFFVATVRAANPIGVIGPGLLGASGRAARQNVLLTGEVFSTVPDVGISCQLEAGRRDGSSSSVTCLGSEASFDALLARLRATEEWRYVDREVELRLSR